VIAAYAFEDGNWNFNSDGSPRRQAYDMSPHQEWLQAQPWAVESEPRLYETYQEMLNRERLDLVVVCLPYARNAFAIAAAAEKGVHVLSEKPVAVNFEDLEMVAKAVRSSGIRLSAMFAMRFSPHIFTVWKAVQSGIIGNPSLARAQKSYKWGANRPWFYKHPEIYGSTMLWVGIHAVDYVRWTTGLEAKRVSGFHSNLSHPGFPGAQDNAVISMQLETGATASITMDFLRPDAATSHGDDRLRIAGTKGVVESFGALNKVQFVSQQSQLKDLELQQPRRSLLADLVAELRGQGTHLIGAHDAIRVTQICIAATEAARKGEVINV
jgi:predicted dehydrogenase